jgi:short-subunit dehydrogenase
MNIVMVARRKKLLDELSSELEYDYKIKTKVLQIDLSEFNSANLVKMATSKEGIKIRLLINNAAFGPWGSFEKTSHETYEKLIQLVATTPISLCHLYMTDLESFPNSLIINLSSPAALQPVPYKAVYSAAKSCLHNFSLALYGEWQDKGIMIQTLLPGPTATEIDIKSGAYQSVLKEIRRPSAEIVNESLRHLDKNIPFVTTYKGTYKQRLFAGIAPIKMVIREVKKMFAPPLGR